jgi:MinD superfamily P-loop ATPase
MDYQQETQMDERTKQAAQAICLRERGSVDEHNYNRCKVCRSACYEYDPEINDEKCVEQPDGCLGFGYQYLAEIALQAADRSS